VWEGFVVLSVSPGSCVAYYTDLVGGGRENYYCGAVNSGEPAGLWYGAGAELLGLSGEVDAELMEAVYHRLLDPRDPATHDRTRWDEASALAAGHRRYRSADEIYEGLLAREPGVGPERRAELRARAEGSAREARAFYDVTFSAPKSVSVLAVAFEHEATKARAAGDEQGAAAWAAMHRAVEDAVLVGAREAMDYLQDVAGYSRTGHHGGGAGEWTDAHRFVVAQFLQHDSRNHDPQLHVHGVILNRVPCADGTWRAIDGTLIHEYKPAAGAIAERAMEAYITRSVGAVFAPRTTAGGAVVRDILGVSAEIREWFSSRSREIGPKGEELLAAFADRLGREASPRERAYLLLQATLATRRGKDSTETQEQRLDRVVAEAEHVTVGGLSRVAREALSYRNQAPPPERFSPREVAARAVARVARGEQTWSRASLMRAVGDELPANLQVAPEEVRPLLEGLVEEALELATPTRVAQSTEGAPPELLLANGRLMHERPGSQRWAARDQIAAERVLRAAAIERGAVAVSVEQANAMIARFAESGTELGVDQAAAVRGVLCSGARVEVICAAAGTGKSFTVGVINQAWRESGARVFGLATAQAAADVLTEEGVPSANIDAWLGAQQRLSQGRPLPGDEDFALRAGDIVTVDEASMVSTQHLAAIHDRCRAAQVKLLLVGDTHQLAAVGAGGAMVDIAERGITYQLSEVRRFTHDWERTASLQLRAGEQTVLGEYAKHGRLMDGGTVEETEAAAGRAWLADTLAGKESLLLVPTNEHAAQVSAALRAQLVRLGKVREAGVVLGMQGTVAGVGDLVQARRNDFSLLGFEGNTTAPVNRTTYRVTATREDGGLIVRRVLGRVEGVEQLAAPLTLPGSYVAQDVTLAYASTVNAAQGRTVDTGHGIVGRGVNAAGAYVMATRGREQNTIWAITRAVPDQEAPGLTSTVAPRTARSVLADLLDAAELQRSALAQREQAEVEARSVLTHADQLIADIGHATAGRVGAILDHLTAQGVLDPHDRVRLAADEAMGALEQLLRTAELAGHDPLVVLTTAVSARELDSAWHPAQALHSRIRDALKGELTPMVTSHADLIPTTVPDHWRPWLHARAEAADNRRRELGAQIATQAPQWARETLGPVPTDVLARAQWEHKAGYAAAYRELANYTNPADPLGPAPGAGLPEKFALWHAAHTTLDLPDVGPEEAALSTGRLLARVQAWTREEAWAPPYVADQLETAHHQAQQHHRNATIWAHRAETTTDPHAAETLRADAATARAEAESLAHLIEKLEVEDNARGQWYLATAPTREAAERAMTQLGLRGVRVDDPTEQVTAQEWLAAHRAEQAAEDAHREIHDEFELDTTPPADFPVDEAAQVLETAIPDIREISTPEVTEHTDPTHRHRLPTASEAAAAFDRARTALAELQARRDYERSREIDEPTRSFEPDHTADQVERDDVLSDH
jgi:conjugative relaxase-like TrwC/TraI family protein